MKKAISLLAMVLFVATAFNVNAQTYKFGHIDSESLLMSLPESETAQKALEAEQKSVMEQLETMQVELNNKYNDYVNNEKLPANDPKKWSPIVKADKEKEMQGLQQRIQEFQETARQQIAAKQKELMDPILKKVEEAIKEVAKENKFTYIFEIRSLLYYSDDSIDITSMVKAKLAVK